MLSEKTRLFGDTEIFDQIMAETSQKKIKEFVEKLRDLMKKMLDI